MMKRVPLQHTARTGKQRGVVPKMGRPEQPGSRHTSIRYETPDSVQQIQRPARKW